MNLIWVILLVVEYLSVCDGINQIQNRLKHSETTHIRTSQFKFIDDNETPMYPTNGKLEFDAFGRVKKLNLFLLFDKFDLHHFVIRN